MKALGSAVGQATSTPLFTMASWVVIDDKRNVIATAVVHPGLLSLSNKDVNRRRVMSLSGLFSFVPR